MNNHWVLAASDWHLPANMVYNKWDRKNNMNALEKGLDGPEKRLLSVIDGQAKLNHLPSQAFPS